MTNDDKRKRPPRPGEGRPRLGKSETVRVVFLATLEQRAVWGAAAERDGMDFSEWARDALDVAAVQKLERR